MRFEAKQSGKEAWEVVDTYYHQYGMPEMTVSQDAAEQIATILNIEWIKFLLNTPD